MNTPPKLPPSNSSSIYNSIVLFNAKESIGNGMDVDNQQNERICSDNSSQDFSGGMTKIVPLEIDVSIFRLCIFNLQ